MDALDRFLQDTGDLLLVGTLHLLSQRRPSDAAPVNTVESADQKELIGGLVCGLGAFLVQAVRGVPLSATPFFLGFVIGYLAALVAVRRDRAALATVLVAALIGGLAYAVPMWVFRVVMVTGIVIELARRALAMRPGAGSSQSVEPR